MLDFSYRAVGPDENICCIDLSGELTAENCDYLLKCVESQIEEGYKKLILDCQQLTYITSMGLGMLVRVNSRMKKIGGDVRLANLHGTGADILKLVGLHKIFQIYDNVDDAVKAEG